MNIGEIAKKYRLIKAQKEQIEKITKEKIDVLKSRMLKLEQQALNFFNETGQTSAKTAYGTPYVKTDISFNVTNADEFFKYVIDNGAVDLLQKRVNSAVAKLYLEDKIKIPGVKIHQENKVVFKK